MSATQRYAREGAAIEVLKAENSAKADFLSFLCHELRNPLHAIVSVTEFLHEVTS